MRSAADFFVNKGAHDWQPWLRYRDDTLSQTYMLPLLLLLSMLHPFCGPGFTNRIFELLIRMLLTANAAARAF